MPDSLLQVYVRESTRTKIRWLQRRMIENKGGFVAIWAVMERAVDAEYRRVRELIRAEALEPNTIKKRVIRRKRWSQK